MTVTYDPEVDVLRVVFRDSPVEESDEESPGFVFDYDHQGAIVGVEILQASRRAGIPKKKVSLVLDWADLVRLGAKSHAG